MAQVVTAQEIRAELPSTAAQGVSTGLLDIYILQAQRLVERTTGELTVGPGQEEEVGMVRDLALSRALIRIHNADPAAIQGAASLRRQTLDQLAAWDKETTTEEEESDPNLVHHYIGELWNPDDPVVPVPRRNLRYDA